VRSAEIDANDLCIAFAGDEAPLTIGMNSQTVCAGAPGKRNATRDLGGNRIDSDDWSGGAAVTTVIQNTARVASNTTFRSPSEGNLPARAAADPSMSDMRRRLDRRCHGWCTGSQRRRRLRFGIDAGDLCDEPLSMITSLCELVTKMRPTSSPRRRRARSGCPQDFTRDPSLILTTTRGINHVRDVEVPFANVDILVVESNGISR